MLFWKGSSSKGRIWRTLKSRMRLEIVTSSTSLKRRDRDLSHHTHRTLWLICRISHRHQSPICMQGASTTGSSRLIAQSVLMSFLWQASSWDITIEAWKLKGPENAKRSRIESNWRIRDSLKPWRIKRLKSSQRLQFQMDLAKLWRTWSTTYKDKAIQTPSLLMLIHP